VVRPLREREYPEWLAEEIAGYADDMAARVAGGREEAQTRAREAYAALLPDGLGTRGVAVRALEVAGERVGTVLVAFTARDLPDCGWVYHVLVDPAHRGHGYGRVLIRVAERECRVAGIRLLGLNVNTDNTVAQALYASLGYRTDLWVLTKPL
jgi:GNAT superfamily N-acetyltransferase